jgi:hypothetical protein
MTSFAYHFHQVSRLDNVKGNWAAELASSLRGFWDHDAATVIPVLALVIAFLALLASRRANRVAAQAQGEHGKIRDARIEFCGLHFGGQRGLTVWESAPIPQVDSPHVTKIAVYGGPDPLRIERLILRIVYTRGKVLCTRLLWTLTLDAPDLRIAGPSIPATVDAYHRVTWELPELIIPSGIYPSMPDNLAAGIYMPTTFERIAFQLIADYGSGQAFTSKPLIYGFLLPFRLIKETRPIHGMTSFMTDPDVPAHIKHLFEQWHQANANQSSASVSSKTEAVKRGVAKTQTRARRRRR